MKISLSKPTLEFLRNIITGDSKLSPYKSGYNIVEFFNELGFKDVYDSRFPSRWAYTQSRLEKLNNTDQLHTCITIIFDPRTYIDNEQTYNSMFEKFNKYLAFDGYEMKFIGKKLIILTLQEDTTKFKLNDLNNEYLTFAFETCDEKLKANELKTAIKSAQMILETVLLHLYYKIKGLPLKYNGNVLELYTIIQRELHLYPDLLQDPLFHTILESITILIQSLTSITFNTRYTVHKRHAQLIINTTKSLTLFFYQTYQYKFKNQPK